MSLIMAESEEKVIKILTRAGYWDNEDAWREYGDISMNFSQVGNQQSRSEQALVEKLINSVDAMLLRECLLSGLDPEDHTNVPNSIQEATEEFFGVINGDLSNLLPSKRSELAESIMLVVTGTKRKPNYLIIDKGEGQTPNKFPDTLVSLNQENKVKIPFVQGKFNMGATGVLQFCGEEKLQLVVSRRHQKIAANEISDSSRDEWGFTIVRRVRPKKTMKTSVYKYLAPSGKVLRFKAQTLPVLPGEYPNPYSNPLEWGTIIKIFEYDLPRALRTNIKLDLYYRLSLMLPEVALPIRLYERRKGYSGHTMEATLSGLKVRLTEDRSENLEPGFPTSATITVHGEQMPCSIYAFKKEKKKRYAQKDGIVLVVNGQAHGFFSKDFFKRNKVGMSYLANSILVLLDCSKLNRSTIEDLFMNSRDRLREVPLCREIETKLEQIIHDHPGLKELRVKRRQEEISDKLDKAKPLQEVLQKIINKSPSLASLLIPGKTLHSPFDLRGVKQQDEFAGEQFPTYFKLISPQNKCCPINRKFRMQFETDAQNDYFDRIELPGEFKFYLNGQLANGYTLNLWNGIANLTVELPNNVNIGDVLKYSTNVTDLTQLELFTSQFKIEVLQQVTRKPTGVGNRIEPPSSKKGDDRKNPSQFEIPHVTEVYKDDWDGKFHEYSALKVEQAGDEGYDFFVNMDNKFLLSELKTRSKEDPELLKAQYIYALVLIGLGLLYDNQREENDDNETTIFDKIESATQGIAAVLMPMLNDLSALIPSDEVSE